MNDLDECYVCEHIRDEHHDGGHECTVAGCDCIMFEEKMDV